MATRITVFEVNTADNGKSYFEVKERRCSACGEIVPGKCQMVCPNCKEVFNSTTADYVSKEG